MTNQRLSTYLLALSVFIVLSSAVAPALRAQMNFFGQAKQLSSHEFELTPNQRNRSGWAFSADKFDLTQPFDYTFEVFLGTSNNGADGMVFILQNDPRGFSAQGCLGEAMGYGNHPNGCGNNRSAITPSIGIEFDTHRNKQQGDPGADHIALLRDGNVNHGSDFKAVGNIEDGNYHLFRIEWNPNTNRLRIHFDDKVVIDKTIDLVNDVFNGETNVIWGFSASTGGAMNSQRFRTPFNALLPVELTTFEAQPVETGVRLNWTTASENNSYQFLVQRSTDGEHFHTLGSVAAAGRSTDARHYDFLDPQKPQGDVFYRLVSEDFDGETDYSKLVSVNGNSLTTQARAAIVQEGNTLRLVGDHSDSELALFDLNGRRLRHTTGERLSTEGLATGIYLARAGKLVKKVSLR